tara:strand:+ start:9270 stop:9965 length:696 start_codon:yes stop_codon:yes gene_type:complete
MKAYCITLKDDELSENGFNKVWQSAKELNCDFYVERFDATNEKNVYRHLVDWDLFWNYPWEGKVTDIATGLTKSAYPTAIRERRIACAISHFRLWTKCFEIKEPILILEHDAKFVKKLDYQYILDSKYKVVGINNPIGATRRARQYHDIIQRNHNPIQGIPHIDEWNIPQGLAGNSAYIIKPEGAEKLISNVFSYGLWPNDAIMCKQLVDDMGVTKIFYTEVQGLKSTTTQ